MERQIAMQLFLAYLPLVLGMTFGLTLGPIVVFRPELLLRLFRSFLPRTNNLPRGFVFVGAGLIFVGLWSLVLVCMSRSPWEQWHTMRRVLLASADEIVSAEIVPWGFRATDNVSGRPLIMRDHDRLRQLCDCLGRSQSWNLGGVGIARKYKLRLCRATGNDTCLVEETGNGIVLLVVYDRDTGGLTIGNPIGVFRCDALGVLIDSWKEEETKGPEVIDSPENQSAWAKQQHWAHAIIDHAGMIVPENTVTVSHVVGGMVIPCEQLVGSQATAGWNEGYGGYTRCGGNADVRNSCRWGAFAPMGR